MSSQTDEETPLLPVQNRKKVKTPLPRHQFSIILALLVVESFASQVIAPFVPQLIRDIGITHGDETRVGYYVGLLHSSYFASNALTVLYWSRLSDFIGRKPVVLTGLFWLSVSMYCSGLSKTFWGLVVSRCLSGALNGNPGIIKSMIAEVTDGTNLSQAYAYMPLAWSTGTALASFVGGSLAKPVDRFPDVFGDWQLFKTYPYFLACAVPATFAIFVWFATFLFLNETLPCRVPLGQWIMTRFNSAPQTPTNETRVNVDTQEPTGRKGDGARLPLRALMVPRVLIAAGNYAALSLAEISVRAIFPLFLATPIELGGLDLDPQRIGNILSVFAGTNGLFQVFFFPRLHDRFGTKVVYAVSVLCGIPLVLNFPLLNAVARAQGLSWTVWALVGMQLVLVLLFEMAYSCIFIYLAAAAPDWTSLGATNGIAQLLVSITRVLGPASATSMFSISLQTPERAMFVYDYMSFLVLASLGASSLLPRGGVWTREMEC